MRLSPRAVQAADKVRAMIASGALGPGDEAPSVEELKKMTGACHSYCQAALRSLVADGTLEPGARPRGERRRVAAPGQAGGTAARQPGG